MYFILVFFIIILLILLLINNQENFENSNEIPFIIITDKEYRKKNINKLNKLGFHKIYFINPVYLKKIDKNIKIKKGEYGCSLAHLEALKLVKKINRPCIILEKDWCYTISNKELKKELIKNYKNYIKEKRFISFLGFCGDGCTHAYIINPNNAEYVLNNIRFNTPIDMLYFLNFCKKFNCYKTKFLTNNNNNKYFGNGLILQDRINIKGMHDKNNKIIKEYI